MTTHLSCKDIASLVASRRNLLGEVSHDAGAVRLRRKEEAEGGCGVIGLASNMQIPGRHLLQSLRQMRNRGNGLGGGIAAVGLVPQEMGVTREVLDRDYILTVAYIDEDARAEVERQHITPVFRVDHMRDVPDLGTKDAIRGLLVTPPKVVQYFVEVDARVREAFRAKHLLALATSAESLEDEIVYQNTYCLNRAFYAASGKKRAFVLSHGRDMLVLKMVGFGDDVIPYYKLENVSAHVWIGHHRYPTKGRVWHSGGAHPFVGLHEALVHNGDFANYFSTCQYLRQRHIEPLFLTDTEVAALLFDLLHRTYGYPLEYVIEALAPTTERDFALLPGKKQDIYRLLQETHIHASPDGPWFFLIAQSIRERARHAAHRLIGVTDTSMLRPQVFALQTNRDADGSEVSIGLAASEKQAIDGALESLAKEDPRFLPYADTYWNARGGSHTDGGAFIFSVEKDAEGKKNLTVTDKFGHRIGVFHALLQTPASALHTAFPETSSREEVVCRSDEERRRAVEALTLQIDRQYASCAGSMRMRRAEIVTKAERSLDAILCDLSGSQEFIAVEPEDMHRSFKNTQTLVFDARKFASDGDWSLARYLVEAYRHGGRKFLVQHAKGHRFIGCGFGPDTKGVCIDVYGSSGDYLASGIDGMEIRVHASAQDQVANVMKDGTLVIYGDVGQTFLYGGKGGKIFVLGNAAGRPLINTVGKPRVVINGTCLDYLAESCMAGDPLEGGGFAIVNGVTLADDGALADLETPFPGGNLFSLASGGAIYIRDPYRRLQQSQLNGGEFAELTPADWQIMLPYLEENERLFGIPVARLLFVSERPVKPAEAYRKIRPKKVRALAPEEAWVAGHRHS